MKGALMNKFVAPLAGALIALLISGPVGAWGHANAYGGGSTYHAPGSDSTTRTNAYGGSATHTYGQGTSASNASGGSAYHAEGSGVTTASNGYGGSATHVAGVGTTASNGYGGTATHAYGSPTTTYTNAYGATAYHSPYYGAAYPAYHPPTTVNVYGSGCYNCGGWSTAGAAAAGVVVGAAVATSVANANNAAATSNAYNAGVAAGVNATAVPSANFPVGAMYGVLPAGCVMPNVQGSTYYLCGNTWFQPAYGANGIYYRVVLPPA
jgi:hypothetical protein